MTSGFLFCVGLALLGGSVMVVTLSRARRIAPDLGEFLLVAERDSYEARVSEPFVGRIAGIVGRMAADRLERLLPQRYLEKIDHQLAQAGLIGERTAAQHLVKQLAMALGCGLVALLVMSAGVLKGLTLPLLLLPWIGFMLPSARLKRTIRARSDAIFKDLPDIIDMLAISVEAGCGFEAALSIVCENFDSPLTDELGIALREMELGLPRREALQELKRRTDLDVVRTFVLALIQADALGIPIGRVLKSQANEVRARRRAWAREKAAKLPVKILFPLMLFIFPPIFAIVLGPAAAAFTKIG
jgi:tight adherence protein C